MKRGGCRAPLYIRSMAYLSMYNWECLLYWAQSQHTNYFRLETCENLRYVGVIRFICHVLHLHNETCVAGSKSAMKHQQKSNWKQDLPNLDMVNGDACFIDFLAKYTKVLPIVFTTECIVIKSWRWSLMSFFNMCLYSVNQKYHMHFNVHYPKAWQHYSFNKCRYKWNSKYTMGRQQ